MLPHVLSDGLLICKTCAACGKQIENKTLGLRRSPRRRSLVNSSDKCNVTYVTFVREAPTNQSGATRAVPIMTILDVLWILGRLLLRAFFAVAGIHHFTAIAPLPAAITARGVPAARLVLLTGSVFQTDRSRSFLLTNPSASSAATANEVIGGSGTSVVGGNPRGVPPMIPPLP
jgi:hypothetical protein